MAIITVEAEQLPKPNNGSHVAGADRDIALFNVEGKFFAIDDECTHHGAPLADGWMQEGVVSCPWHCWQFDVATGKCLTAPGMDVRAYQVTIENGAARIEIDE